MPKIQNFIQLSLNLTKLCRIKRNHWVNFDLSRHIQHELLLFDNKQWVKTHSLSNFFLNSKQNSVEIFLYKVHIMCSKCPPPAEAHAFRRLQKSLIALLIVVCGKSSQICCSALFSSEIVLSFEWSLWNAWSIAPHNDSKVGWGLVNLVAIHPLRWSWYGEKWKFIGWLHFIRHNFIKFRDIE